MSRRRDEESLVELAAALRVSVIPLGRALRSTATDVTPTQLSVLGAIYRNQPLSMGDLAEKEHLSPAMISRVVTTLVDAGLVERLPGEQDRRICRVQVSEEGQRWIDRTRAQSNAWLAERLALLDAQQRQLVAEAAPLLELLVDDDRG